MFLLVSKKPFGKMIARLSAAADITQKVAILQAKIIPTSAAAEVEKIK
jgi:hypothetical protein